MTKFKTASATKGQSGPELLQQQHLSYLVIYLGPVYSYCLSLFFFFTLSIKQYRVGNLHSEHSCSALDVA